VAGDPAAPDEPGDDTCRWCGLTDGSFHGEGICNGAIHELATGPALRCRLKYTITLPVRVTTVLALVTCADCIASWPQPLRDHLETRRAG
jgi:hypothetical protein